jgi:hypothetical protein
LLERRLRQLINQLIVVSASWAATVPVAMDVPRIDGLEAKIIKSSEVGHDLIILSVNALLEYLDRHRVRRKPKKVCDSAPMKRRQKIHPGRILDLLALGQQSEIHLVNVAKAVANVSLPLPEQSPSADPKTKPSRAAPPFKPPDLANSCEG